MKRVKGKAAVFEENADLMGTVVFWAYGRKAREEEDSAIPIVEHNNIYGKWLDNVDNGIYR